MGVGERGGCVGCHSFSAQEINLKEIFQKTCDGLVRDGVYINLDNPNEG
jgi:hypothetical protein